jgi:hypothetical protein
MIGWSPSRSGLVLHPEQRRPLLRQVQQDASALVGPQLRKRFSAEIRPMTREGVADRWRHVAFPLVPLHAVGRQTEAPRDRRAVDAARDLDVNRRTLGVIAGAAALTHYAMSVMENRPTLCQRQAGRKQNENIRGLG